MNVQQLGTTATQETATPFAAGFDAVFFNSTGAASTLSGSDDGTNYVTLASAVATGSCTQVKIMKYMKVGAATAGAYLLV